MPELESVPVPPLAGMLPPYLRRKTLEDLADQSAPKRKAAKRRRLLDIRSDPVALDQVKRSRALGFRP